MAISRASVVGVEHTWPVEISPGNIIRRRYEATRRETTIPVEDSRPRIDGIRRKQVSTAGLDISGFSERSSKCAVKDVRSIEDSPGAAHRPFIDRTIGKTHARPK